MTEEEEIVKTVLTHLRSMKTRSVIPEHPDTGVSQCVYRNADGNKCAVGCLIPDELYDPVMEGGTLAQQLHVMPESLKSLFSRHLGVLMELQIIHDNSRNWDENGLKPVILEDWEKYYYEH